MKKKEGNSKCLAPSLLTVNNGKQWRKSDPSQKARLKSSVRTCDIKDNGVKKNKYVIKIGFNKIYNEKHGLMLSKAQGYFNRKRDGIYALDSGTKRHNFYQIICD